MRPFPTARSFCFRCGRQRYTHTRENLKPKQQKTPNITEIADVLFFTTREKQPEIGRFSASVRVCLSRVGDRSEAHKIHYCAAATLRVVIPDGAEFTISHFRPSTLNMDVFKRFDARLDFSVPE